MRLNRLLPLVLVAVAAIALTGCGSSTDDAANTSTTANAPTGGQPGAAANTTTTP